MYLRILVRVYNRRINKLCVLAIHTAHSEASNKLRFSDYALLDAHVNCNYCVALAQQTKLISVTLQVSLGRQAPHILSPVVRCFLYWFKSANACSTPMKVTI